MDFNVWGPTIGFLEMLNRAGKVLEWIKVKVMRFYQGQSSKTPKISGRYIFFHIFVNTLQILMFLVPIMVFFKVLNQFVNILQ